MRHRLLQQLADHNPAGSYFREFSSSSRLREVHVGVDASSHTGIDSVAQSVCKELAGPEDSSGLAAAVSPIAPHSASPMGFSSGRVRVASPLVATPEHAVFPAYSSFEQGALPNWADLDTCGFGMLGGSSLSAGGETVLPHVSRSHHRALDSPVAGYATTRAPIASTLLPQQLGSEPSFLRASPDDACSICLMPIEESAEHSSILVTDSAETALTMPCCRTLVHVVCLSQCLQLRAIRKNCCACQKPFSRAVDDALATAEESAAATRDHARAMLQVALAAGLSSLL